MPKDDDRELKTFTCYKYAVIDDRNKAVKKSNGPAFFRGMEPAEDFADKHDHLRVVELYFKDQKDFIETKTARVERILKEIERGSYE